MDASCRLGGPITRYLSQCLLGLIQGMALEHVRVISAWVLAMIECDSEGDGTMRADVEVKESKGEDKECLGDIGVEKMATKHSGGEKKGTEETEDDKETLKQDTDSNDTVEYDKEHALEEDNESIEEGKGCSDGRDKESHVTVQFCRYTVNLTRFALFTRTVADVSVSAICSALVSLCPTAVKAECDGDGCKSDDDDDGEEDQNKERGVPKFEMEEEKEQSKDEADYEPSLRFKRAAQRIMNRTKRDKQFTVLSSLLPIQLHCISERDFEQTLLLTALYHDCAAFHTTNLSGSGATHLPDKVPSAFWGSKHTLLFLLASIRVQLKMDMVDIEPVYTESSACPSSSPLSSSADRRHLTGVDRTGRSLLWLASRSESGTDR